MKFVGRYLFPVLTIVVSEASTVRKSTFDTSNVDKKKLMANAQVKEGTHRDLQNIQLTGRESIVFKSCETLSVDVAVDNADIQQAMINGNVKAVKSFVEFDVCQSEFCFTGIEGTRTTYVTSLADYLAAFSSFLPSKQQDYCQGCLDHVDYCPFQYTSYNDQRYEQSEQYEQYSREKQNERYERYEQWHEQWYEQYEQNKRNQQNKQNEQYEQSKQNKQRWYNQYKSRNSGNGGHRSLQGDVIYETIDCSRCYKYGCLYTDNEFYNSDREWAEQRSLEWMQSVASCYRDDENPVLVDGMQASFGFMCNQEGTGVEIAVFMDNECTLYNNRVAFGNVMSSTDSFMWSKSKANVQYMFNNDFSCYDPDVVYVAPDFDWGNIPSSNNYGADYQPQAAEWCWKVFEGDMTPVSLTDCGGQGYYDYMLENYTLSQDEANDAAAVCSKLNVSGGGEHLYSRYTSGAMYSYVSRSSSSSTTYNTKVTNTNSTLIANDWMTTLDEMSPQYRSSVNSKQTTGWIYGICSVVAAGFVVIGVAFRSKNSASSTYKEEPNLSTEYVAA